MPNDKTLSDSAKSNPTALGDPVSLKAEKSDSSPTEKDRPNRGSQTGKSNPVQNLKELAPTEQDINQSTQRPALQGHQQGIKQLMPTEQDLDQSTQKSAPQPSDRHEKSLKEVAQQDLKGAEKGNPSMLGDPTSLKAETVERDPVKGEEEDGTGRSGATPTKGRDSKL